MKNKIIATLGIDQTTVQVQKSDRRVRMQREILTLDWIIFGTGFGRAFQRSGQGFENRVAKKTRDSWIFKNRDYRHLEPSTPLKCRERYIWLELIICGADFDCALQEIRARNV